MDFKKVVVDALARLDPENDAHWTVDGLPRLDVMKDLSGMDISRADIFSVAKKFNRKNMEIDYNADSEIELGEDTDNDGQSGNEDSGAEGVVEASVEASYKASREKLLAAQKEFQYWQAEMDKIIAKQERERKGVSFADSVKMYQKSQLDARKNRFKR